MDTFKYNYKTTLPKEANAQSVTIDGVSGFVYDIEFYSNRGGKNILISKTTCRTGETAYALSNQWYSEWVIFVKLNGETIDRDVFNLVGKTVFIKMDAYALGDNIAWMPYVEAFRIKHGCTVLCSTFYNDLFSEIYPNILFTPINTNIDNVYSQYYIGASNDGNTKYSPISVDENPLQKVATEILGLDYLESRPQLEKQFKHLKYNKKYVCLSEHASHIKKTWRHEGGWQEVVDWLILEGYEVVVISKEPTELKHIIDLTGDFPLKKRAQTLLDADFFLGVSSGLSWLSWGVNSHVVMVSDCTQITHEFKNNITRISANETLRSVDFDAPSITQPQTVIDSIKSYLNQIN